MQLRKSNKREMGLIFGEVKFGRQMTFDALREHMQDSMERWEPQSIDPSLEKCNTYLCESF